MDSWRRSAGATRPFRDQDLQGRDYAPESYHRSRRGGSYQGRRRPHDDRSRSPARRDGGLQDRRDRESWRHHQPHHDDDDDEVNSCPPGRFDPRPWHLQGAKDYGLEVSYEEGVDLPNYGDADVDPEAIPQRLLLVRALKTADEKVFAKGLEKLSAADGSDLGAGPGSLHRVFLIRDRQTNRSMTFGFAEYYSKADVRAAAAKADRLGDSFTISSRPVLVAFPHPKVFIPYTQGIPSDRDEHHFEMNGTRSKYYDERYYAREFIVNTSPPERASEPSPDTAEDAGVADKPAETGPRLGEATSDEPQKVAGAPKATLEDQGQKRKTVAKPSKVLNVQMQRWQQKSAELRQDDEEPQEAEVDQTAPALQTFAHVGDTISCYLCFRKFANMSLLDTHIRTSQLHTDNLKDEAAVEQAYARLEKKGISPDSTIKLLSATKKPQQTSDEEPAETYVDRAAQRRKEEAKAKPAQFKFSLKQKPDATPTAASAPSFGKGLGMLQKAGWKEGQGLGARGEGMTGSVEQQLYAAGVGLGHESARIGDAATEAARRTKDEPTSFLDKTKEVARKRFESMK